MKPHSKLPAVVALMMLVGLAFRGTAAVAAPSGQSAAEVASYRMEVRLDPRAKIVSGTERIRYVNPSGDTLNEIYLRLYLKAFASNASVWMQESGGQHRGFKDSTPGDIAVEALHLADGTSLLEAATLDDTLLHVPLPRALGPGQTLELDLRWTSTLPRVFARTGYGGRDDTFFMVGQWYPKMSVYLDGQWDTEPWHSNAEFFHDFGSYDVTVRAPAEYIVAGAGVPAAGPYSEGAERVWQFRATAVTDFAFAASPDFRTRSAKSANGVDVWLFYLPEHEAAADEYMAAATGAVAAFSDWYGQYPHERLSVIDVPDDAAGAGGMEYPTLVTGGTVGGVGQGFISYVTAHEIGHQWWPMQTATNEGREPWLDEGFTEYSGSRYMQEAGVRIGSNWASISAIGLDRGQAATAPGVPLNQPAWQYSGSSYAGAVYGRTALGLWTLERVVGTDRFRKAMAAYLAEWRFRHPGGADFRASIEESLGPQPWFFDQYANGNEIGYAVGPIANDASSEHVTVTRTGTVSVPVSIRVLLASGAERLEWWDGRQGSIELRYPGDRIASVQIDPERQLVAEQDVLDNGAHANVDLAPVVTLLGRLAAFVQLLSQLIGTFG